MKNTKIKWGKVIFWLALTVVFLGLTIEASDYMVSCHGSWVYLRRFDYVKAYDALSFLVFTIIFVTICASALIISLRKLVLCFIQPKRPSVFTRASTKYGVYPTLILLAILVLLIAADACLWTIISNTPDLGEAPQTTDMRILCGWVEVAAQLVLEATVVMFVSWLQNILRRRRKQRIDGSDTKLIKPSEGSADGQNN